MKDETTGDVCEALSLKEIMKNNEIDLIDILKLDVEGTEDILFRDVVFLETLNLVKVLGIEIHDDMASREMIHEELRKKRFDFFEQGELTVAWNKSHFHE